LAAPLPLCPTVAADVFFSKFLVRLFIFSKMKRKNSKKKSPLQFARRRFMQQRSPSEAASGNQQVHVLLPDE
jgi:hypothetical protein